MDKKYLIGFAVGIVLSAIGLFSYNLSFKKDEPVKPPKEPETAQELLDACNKLLADAKAKQASGKMTKEEANLLDAQMRIYVDKIRALGKDVASDNKMGDFYLIDIKKVTFKEPIIAGTTANQTIKTIHPVVVASAFNKV